MSKNSSVNYYQDNKERLDEKLKNDIKVFLRKKKEKRSNTVVKDTQVYWKMKNKGSLSIEKNITKWEKTLYYNYEKLLSFRNFNFFSWGWTSRRNLFQEKLGSSYLFYLFIKSQLDRQNQQPSRVMRNVLFYAELIFLLLSLISCHLGVLGTFLIYGLDLL